MKCGFNKKAFIFAVEKCWTILKMVYKAAIV